MPPSRRAKKAQPEPERDESGDHYAGIESDEEYTGHRGKKSKGYFSGIKWTHVALLLMLTGTAVLPVVVLVVEHVGGAVGGLLPGLGPLGERLGFVQTPRNRLEAFYQKHNPEKVAEVDAIVAKYRGDYKTMTKKLEAKYHDYGFFIGWEKENDFAAVQKRTYDFVAKHGNKLYQRYLPFPVRNGLRNVYYNVYMLYDKAMKLIDPKPSKKKPRRKSKSN